MQRAEMGCPTSLIIQLRHYGVQSVEWHTLFVGEDFCTFWPFLLSIIKNQELNPPKAGIVTASNATWVKGGPTYTH